jgi:hypothetical protein
MVKHPAKILELDGQVANCSVLTRKSIDILVEGRFPKTSGEDRTAIEHFIACVRDWDTGLRRFLDASVDGKWPYERLS